MTTETAKEPTRLFFRCLSRWSSFWRHIELAFYFLSGKEYIIDIFDCPENDETIDLLLKHGAIVSTNFKLTEKGLRDLTKALENIDAKDNKSS